MIKIKLLIYISVIFMAKSCLNVKTDSTPATADTEIDQQLAYQIEGLETYMLSTHFTGHISNIKIDTQKLPDSVADDSLVEEIHVVNADVVETFVGLPIDKIEFKIITEEGETIQFEKEIIISLCLSNNEFSWADTGSVFPASSLFIQNAIKIKKSKMANHSPSFCESGL